LITVWTYDSWVKWLKKGCSEGRGKGAIEWPTEPNRNTTNALEGIYMHSGDILQRQSSFDSVKNGRIPSFVISGM
jgi:hypothetical protein